MAIVDGGDCHALARYFAGDMHGINTLVTPQPAKVMAMEAGALSEPPRKGAAADPVRDSPIVEGEDGGVTAVQIPKALFVIFSRHDLDCAD